MRAPWLLVDRSFGALDVPAAIGAGVLPVEPARDAFPGMGLALGGCYLGIERQAEHQLQGPEHGRLVGRVLGLAGDLAGLGLRLRHGHQIIPSLPMPHSPGISQRWKAC